jgi:hypothetical protein
MRSRGVKTRRKPLEFFINFTDIFIIKKERQCSWATKKKQ